MKEAWTRALERFGIRFGYPRILGTYLAVNAIPDVWMLVDSADCATMRAEFIHDNHDWNSTLIAEDGKHRIANSGACPDSIVMDRRELLAGLMRDIGQEEGSYLLVYPSPITALLGVDYDSVFESVKDSVEMKMLTIRPVESLGDWVSGYCHVMETLARNIELPDVVREPDSVAVVGYMWDRNEADHRANVAELGRLLNGLGLDLKSVWLSGAPTTGLADVAGADTIIEFPYAGSAARILAERTGARIVTTHLPVGLEATCRWMELVAGATGRAERAREWLDSEAGHYYAALSKAVLRYFANRDFIVCTESHLGCAVARMLTEFGGNVRLLACSGRRVEPDERIARLTLYSPEMRRLGGQISEIVDGASLLPVVIANEQAMATIPTVPVAGVFLGFQSPGTHHLFDAPFLGFRGTLSLVDRIVNSLPVGFLLHR